jgi:hypothetical protein
MSTVIFNTAGNGLWSKVATAVRIEDIQVNYVDEDLDSGELCVYFNMADWDVDTDGLIYTDNVFLEELRNFLNLHGLAGADVDYSEQGMQEDYYVSLDVGKEFLKTWARKFGKRSLTALLD